MGATTAVHWRAREAAEWAVRHSALDTFKIETGEFRDRRMIFHNATQAELLGMLADPSWKVISVSWFPKEFRGSARCYAIAFLPAALMRSHEEKDIKRYAFEVPDMASVEKALKQKRSGDLASKRVRAGAAAQ